MWIDKTRFYIIGAGLFTGITVALFPFSVLKTRLQVATKNAAEKNAYSILKDIIKTDGIPGLYKGFGAVITGAIPARIVFLTSLETTKVAAFKMIEPLKLSEPMQAAVANGVAGLTAALLSQAIFVPVDVVSQKLMVQGYSGYMKYKNGLDVVRTVIKMDGIWGLYRGFALSAMTYSPSSAVWWASYGSSQRVIWKFHDRVFGYGIDVKEPCSPSWETVVGVQSMSGIVAGAIASCITTPLDTVKTKLQVMEYSGRKAASEVVKALILEHGWRGLYRGLGPRFVSMSAWGTSMILAYEYLKRLCAKDDALLSY